MSYEEMWERWQTCCTNCPRMPGRVNHAMRHSEVDSHCRPGWNVILRTLKNIWKLLKEYGQRFSDRTLDYQKENPLSAVNQLNIGSYICNPRMAMRMPRAA